MEQRAHMAFGDLLRRYRAAVSLTQEERAARAGLSACAITYPECVARTPTYLPSGSRPVRWPCRRPSRLPSPGCHLLFRPLASSSRAGIRRCSSRAHPPRPPCPSCRFP